jgi:ribosomal protein S18 acetylase RimI-like enzyme
MLTMELPRKRPGNASLYIKQVLAPREYLPLKTLTSQGALPIGATPLADFLPAQQKAKMPCAFLYPPGKSSDNCVSLIYTRQFSEMSSTTIFKVRPATLRDAKAIAEIHTTTLRASLQSGADPAPVVTVEKRQAFWREAIEYSEPQVHVALDEEKIVGFVGFDRSRDKQTPPTMGELWALYVLPAYWGKGVGLALWDAAREGLQEEGCTHVSVWLALNNERALRFHELAGFKREPANVRKVPMGAGRLEEIRLQRTLG